MLPWRALPYLQYGRTTALERNSPAAQCGGGVFYPACRSEQHDAAATAPNQRFRRVYSTSFSRIFTFASGIIEWFWSGYIIMS